MVIGNPVSRAYSKIIPFNIKEYGIISSICFYNYCNGNVLHRKINRFISNLFIYKFGIINLGIYNEVNKIKSTQIKLKAQNNSISELRTGSSRYFNACN